MSSGDTKVSAARLKVGENLPFLFFLPSLPSSFLSSSFLSFSSDFSFSSQKSMIRRFSARSCNDRC